MKKEFGKLSREQLQRYQDSYSLFTHCRDDVGDFSREHHDLDQILIPWAGFYELDFNTFTALFIEIMGWLEPLQEIIKTEDPQEAWLNFSEAELAAEIEGDEPDDEEKALLFAMFQSIIGNLSALSTFHQPLSVLVERARAGDDEALFKAVFIDRSSVAAPTIAKRIAKAQASEDEAFMNRLAKAITRTNPRKPDPKLDEQRFATELLDHAVDGLDNLSSTQVYDVIYEELQVNQSDADYSLSTLRKFLKKRKKLRGEL